MRKLIHAGLILGVTGTALFLGATPAGAVCQSFTITAAPEPVQEGGATTVTVSRIGTGPASIDVDGLSGTAKSGSDFEPVNRTISFTNETSESFKVKIINDSSNEPQEQFRLHLSKESVTGCTADDDFTVGADEIVRIFASDTETTPSPTTTPAATSTPSRSSTSTPDATTSPSPSPSLSPSPSPSASPTFTPFATATPGEDDDDGTSALAITGILVAALALLAGIALLLYARRTRL